MIVYVFAYLTVCKSRPKGARSFYGSDWCDRFFTSTMKLILVSISVDIDK